MNTIDTSLTFPKLDTPVADPAALSVLRGEARPEFLRDELLCEIFAASAARDPNKSALRSDAAVLTYAALDAQALVIARGLVRRGVRPGDVVGLWMARGIALLVAQIAIAKTGAAWLPFDADAPVERIAICLRDAAAKAVLVSCLFEPRLRESAPCAIVTTAALTDPSDLAPVDARALGATPDHPAYVIYTSGSTGAPKGIVITGRNICHFLRAANSVYGVTADDVIFQGASVAFDLSMEEIWVPYLAGATLVVATPEMLGEADRLPALMEEAGVTVLDTVPTLLGLLPRDVASLRLILLGGEACPPSVAARWSRPGRTIFNTYGPTEATVVATTAPVLAGEPVTIGGPIPNYTCYVVDDALRLAPPGVEGELLIGGPGVARGYLNRDALTADKFIANPFASDGTDPVLYRSGDAVALDAAGRLAFRGRIDDQVKVRGFRVELGEIETRVALEPHVAQAAVVLRTDDGFDQLVAFIVADADAAIDVGAMRAALRGALPAYMVPARFEAVDALPRLSSGKIDRNALKRAALTTAAPTEAQEEPRDDIEAALLEAARKVLPPQAIPFDADFFTDLGGHSLIAARFISIVRTTPALAAITLQSVYENRSLRKMAAALAAHQASFGVAQALDLSFTPPPLMRRFLCGCAQAVALVFIMTLVTLQWLGLFVASTFLLTDGTSLLGEMPILLGLYVLINVGAKSLIVGLKWLVLGRTKPGRYPLWGVYYFRVWFVQRMVQVTTMKFLQGSPLMRWYMRALGASVGRDAIIAEFEAGAIDLLSIGDRASIGLKTKFANVECIGDEMIIGRVTIGDDVTTGNSCVIGRDVSIGEGAELEDITSVRAGSVIAAWEIWDGSPATKVGLVDRAARPAFPEASTLRRAAHNVVYVASYIVCLMLGLLPIFPAFYVLYNLDSIFKNAPDLAVSWTALPFLAWPTALILILVSVAIIVAVRWVLLPRVRTGTFSIHSNFYLRKWVVGLALEVTLETLSSLYATIYMRIWYRLMGAKIGRGSEISTNLAGRYDLVDIGADNFVGDEVILGDEEVRAGFMTLGSVKTGDRVFIGNEAVIGPGAVIGEGALIGVKSKLPNDLQVAPGEIWFGSPAMKLPVRQRVDLGAKGTYDPPASLRRFRAVFEALHTSLPTALFITFGYMTADIIGDQLGENEYSAALGTFALSGLAIAAVMIVVVAIIKWTLMGRYKPTMYPMWSAWAMKTEMVAVLYGGLVGKSSIEFLRGTPFLPWVLRLYGVKIGKGVWMELTDITEFDCVTIGDFCTLNMTACLQTHLYEDRIMKVGRIELGRGVYVGTGTTVLYDTKIGDYAQLAPLTLVMKGEHIPANTVWGGAPAQPGAIYAAEPKVAAA